MTAEEKAALAVFLDTTADSLRDGRRRARPAYSFSDDAAPAAPSPDSSAVASAALPGKAAGPEPAHQANAPRPDPASARRELAALATEVRACTGCGLCETRTQAVPGVGVPSPLLLVVGEGPGADEDAKGEPFVGKAGQLLDKMLASIGLSRETNCFIANVVKCRPPQNRDPLPEEIAACRHFLKRQIAILSPASILCVGRFAAQTLLNTTDGIGRLRGHFGIYTGRTDEDLYAIDAPASPLMAAALAIPLLPTYHPSALLRDESLKRPAWEDLKLLRSRLVELSGDYAQSSGEIA